MALLTSDVEPLWIARFDYPRGVDLPLHAHPDYFQVILLMSGTGDVVVESRHYPMQPGLLVFLRPGVLHGLETGTAATARTLDTKFRIHRPELLRACQQVSAVHLDPHPRIASLLETMLAEAQRAGRFSSPLCQTILSQIILLLLNKTPCDTADAQSVEDELDQDADLCVRLRRFLRAHCGEALTQRKLSETFRCSYRHLHALYTARYGESPLRDLWQFRIERAMKLIRYSDYELKEIATLCGFVTVHHFGRVFTRVAGVSPGRWRDDARHKNQSDVSIQPGFFNPLLVRDPGRSSPIGSRSLRSHFFEADGGPGVQMATSASD